MDRRDNQQVEKQSGFEQESEMAKGESHFVMEDGKRFRMPYTIIKKVTFSNLDQTELQDIPHCARLQYRLLLFDAVIKAKVDYHKKFIRIVYNHPEAENIKEKISRDKLIEFLAGEGVHVRNDAGNMEEVDYDYKKELYDYAYFPPSIREAPPYGWTREEWKQHKAEQEKKKRRLENPTIIDKVLGRNKTKKKKGPELKLHP
jgi:hypothetical protein